MADSDKNIRITTSKNKPSPAKPTIVFTGASAGTSVLTLEVRDDNTLAITGSDGDVFTLDYNLSTGTIWSVNDKSGTPFLRASAGGTIGIAEFGSGVLVGIGQTNPQYKLDVQGWAGFASTGDGSYTALFENGSTVGNNAFSIRGANSLRFYNSGNALYTGFKGAQSGVNTTYILPPRTPTGTATSYLSSGIDGVMAWVAAPTSGGSGSVNSGTANFAAYYATTSNAVSENANLQFTGTGISVGGLINSTSTSSGSFFVRGGVGITGNAFIGGTTVITNSQSSSSTTSGALSVTGGLGLLGNAFIGGTVNVTSTTVSTSTTSGALVVSGGAGIAGSLFTGTGFSSSISGVVMVNGNVSATTYNKVTITAPASNATLTLATGSSLITSGGHSLTFNTTNTTSLTLPTTGTLATTSNKLSDFAATTSSELFNTITGETGSGALVFGTSPDFTTSVTTSDTTFSVFNTNASTINAFGAATTLSLGAASGKATINSSDNSTSLTTGAFVVTGGSAIGKSLSVGGSLNIFNGSNFAGFRFAGSANTVYTLPPAAPTGTGTSYLSASVSGVMAWVAAPTSGGGSPGGTNIGDIQYKSGTSFAASTTFNYEPDVGQLSISSFPLSAVNSSSAALKLLGTSQSWSSGSSLGTYLAINAATGFVGGVVDVRVNNVQRLYLSGDGYLSLGATGTGFTFPITNGSSGQVLTANTNGVASWTTVTGSSGAGSGTVAIPGAQYQVAAYYSGTGASVSGSATFTNSTATGVVNITHTTGSASTTTGALVVTGGVGIGGSLNILNNINIRSQSDLLLWNATNTQYTALQAGNTANSYTLSLPTAQVGAGSSIMITGSDGQMYFAAPGSGIAFSAATANTPVVRAKRGFTMQFCAGYTPTAAGPDTVILKIPESASDGISDITFILRELDIRVETPSAGQSRIQLEKYSGTTAFALGGGTGNSMIGGFGITLTGAGTYFTSTSSFAAGALVTSNDKLRLNWTLLNATHANFSVQLTMEEV